MPEILYATSRQKTQKSDRSADFVDYDDLGRGPLQYGVVRLDNPFEPDLAARARFEDWSKLGLTTLTRQEFRARLQRAEPYLLYIHGFQNTFAKSLSRGFALQNSLGLPVVIYSWPAGALAEHYSNALDNLSRSVDHLTDLLMHLNDVRGSGLRVLAHSMGSHLLVSALNPNLLSSSPGLHKIVFSAADSLQQLFCHLAEQNIGEASIECVLLTSSKDWALYLSELMRDIPGFISARSLPDDNRTGSGSRAGYSHRSLCLQENVFQTVDCSNAHCTDTYNHGYCFSSDAVLECLHAFYSGANFIDHPHIQLTDACLLKNNGDRRRLLKFHQVKGV